MILWHLTINITEQTVECLGHLAFASHVKSRDITSEGFFELELASLPLEVWKRINCHHAGLVHRSNLFSGKKELP